MNEKQNKKSSRRAFLESGITGGIGVALGLAAGKLLEGPEPEKPEMVRMLTADGSLVEVEKQRIPVMCGKPIAVSNQELKEWMENNGNP